ncbi:hypothetical protein [Metabacillus arenae]|uniref:Uncharacterized protein n=1 Tax=Metabacillus arenae TaxID=2771434 RepID=A0A926RXW9_9BACI|nr:hypothetical protein [Metabacillus arenae]MBD1381406.1 hypothetical protein [Metabacillus arenae]
MKSIFKSRAFAVAISFVLAVGIFLYQNGQDQLFAKEVSKNSLHILRAIFNK